MKGNSEVMLKRLEILAQEAIEEPKPVTVAPVPVPTGEPRGYEPLISLLLLTLQAIGARSINFVSHLIPVIGLTMGFVLWYSVLPDPSVHQLIGLGIYGSFVLAMIAIKKV